jgi:hypothetical protein
MSSVVHLIGSISDLLGSGDPRDCIDPLNDSNCTGGVVAVEAFRRNWTQGEPSVVSQRLDRYSAFAQMHPLGWSVNRVALHDTLGYEHFSSTHALLSYSAGEDAAIPRQDISGLQSLSFPMLLTNVVIPPSNSWYSFSEAVHFDNATGLAILSIADSNEPMAVPQVESAIGMLDFVHKLNVEARCARRGDSNEDNYLNVYSTNTTQLNQQCWIPVIWFGDVKSQYDLFKSNIMDYRYPPALIIDTDGNDANYTTPQRVGNKGVWLVSLQMDGWYYNQFSLTLNPRRTNITNVEFIQQELWSLPPELKDHLYYEQYDKFAYLAQEAVVNNPVVGRSTEMPATRIDNYRRCKAGECELGDLFTDALLWKSDADVAFITSGGIRGLGWPAGPVRLSYLWEALPFPNTLCEGVMSGISLARMFNYSTAVASFQGEESDDNGNLLQVSGARVTYNTKLKNSRLIKLEIWNKTEGKYLPMERLKMYKFATDNYLCEANGPYPDLLGSDLIIPGEVAGVVSDALHQEIVADYLSQLNATYVVKIHGRLVNDTTAFTTLNFIQNSDECELGSYWDEVILSCTECPSSDRVTFSDKQLEFDGDSQSFDPILGNITLYNNEAYEVFLNLKNIPSWVQPTKTALNGTKEFKLNSQLPIFLPSRAFFTFDFALNTSHLEPGTALGTVSFGVSDGGTHPGCEGQDATFDILARINPPLKLNQIGSIRSLGWSLTTIACFTAVFFAVWVLYNSNKRIVAAMQPLFLITVCVGVFIMALTIIPLSIDDGIVSESGCNIACMCIPWLVSTGFSVTFSAIFSKLWRINRIFHSRNFRRKQVNERDVLLPFGIVFALNLITLVTWTAVDPLRWRRRAVRGEPWNTYGVCESSGPVGIAFMVLTVIINLSALCLACHQAYKARTISGDFSESKSLALAIYSWLQLCIIGFPVLYLIYNDNQAAKYFLSVLLIFAVCMSMLLFIFLPLVFQLREYLSHSMRSRRKLSVVVGDRGSLSNHSGSFYPRASSVYAASMYNRSMMESTPEIDNSDDDDARAVGARPSVELSAPRSDHITMCKKVTIKEGSEQAINHINGNDSCGSTATGPSSGVNDCPNNENTPDATVSSITTTTNLPKASVNEHV